MLLFFSCNCLIKEALKVYHTLPNIEYFLCFSLLDGMDQRKADLLETQLLVEQLEQREQMLEAQNEMLEVQRIILNF